MIDLHLPLMLFVYLQSDFSGELRETIFFARVRFGRIFQLMWLRYLNVTDRQTDRRTDGQNRRHTMA